MLIDYLPMMLVNMTAALVLVALFFLTGLGKENEKHWAAGFAITGLVAAVSGFHMAFNWPLHNIYWANVAFGEPSVLLGMTLLGAALAIARGWNMLPIGIFAAFAGAAAIVIGSRIGLAGLTAKPPLTCLGFILAGTGAILTLPTIHMPSSRMLRLVTAAFLLASAAIWALTGYGAYVMHVSRTFGPK